MTLEKIRSEIEQISLDVYRMGATYTSKRLHQVALSLDATIAEERAKPESGDVVAWRDGDGYDVIVFDPETFGDFGMEDGDIVLMRAADVRRKIEEASS